MDRIFKCESTGTSVVLSTKQMFVLISNKIKVIMSEMPPIIPRYVAGIRITQIGQQHKLISISCTDNYYYYHMTWHIKPEITMISHFYEKMPSGNYIYTSEDTLIPIRPVSLYYSPYKTYIGNKKSFKYDFEYPVSMIHIDLTLFCGLAKYKECRPIFDYLQPHLKLPKDVKQIILQYMYML